MDRTEALIDRYLDERGVDGERLLTCTLQNVHAAAAIHAVGRV